MNHRPLYILFPVFSFLMAFSLATAQPTHPRLWSDASIWGGTKPVAGQDVVIPADWHLILDENTPSLGGITLLGTLEFAEMDLELTAEWMMVHGMLRIGSEDNPFFHKAILTLTASDTGEQIMNMGTRGIMVMGGQLELHGSAPLPWTKISQHADRGTSGISVLSAQGWQTGDEIIVAPTDFFMAANGNSVTQSFLITGINGGLIQLNDSLDAFRWGLLQYASANGMSLTASNPAIPPVANTDSTSTPLVLDERAAVGNLSRAIVIQAPDDAVWQNERFGVHVMIMGTGAVAHVEGVEIRRGGQRGRLGRYPFHWHMLSYLGTQTLGDATGQYFRNSSVHSSGNRGIVIHGTNGVTVKNNVVFDIQGHGIFTEDAVERRTTIDSNLVLMVRNVPATFALKQHETANFGASCFWISNPDNLLTNNHAGDCSSFGFWMAFPTRPWGESSQVLHTDGLLLNPSRLRFGVFHNNTAHSNGQDGIRLDDPEIDNSGNTYPHQYQSTTNGRDSEWNSGTLRRFTLSSYKTWKNGHSGIWDRGVWATNFEVVSADNCGRFFAGSGADGIIERSLVVGTSLNHLMNATDRIPFADAAGGNETPAAFATYHSAFDIRNNIVINFPLVANTRSGAFATEDYYLRPVDKGQARNINNLLIQSHPGVKLPSMFNYYALAGALWDPNGNWAGVPGDWYYVYDEPFFTYGQTPLAAPGGSNAGGVLVEGPFYGVNDFEINRGNDPQADLMEIEVARLDATGTEVGSWHVEEAGAADWLLAHMRHFAAQGSGTYELEFPGIDTVFDVAMTVENMLTADDTLLLGVEYSGRYAISQVYISSWPNFMDSTHAVWPTSFNLKHVYTEATSLATIQPRQYFHDSAANVVWVKMQGGIGQPWNDNDHGVFSDERLYRRFALRVYGTRKPDPVPNPQSIRQPENRISVYPNPAKEMVHVEGAGEGSYSVRDITGRLCKEGKMNADGTISLEQLQMGIYIVEVRNGEYAKSFRVVRQ